MGMPSIPEYRLELYISYPVLSGHSHSSLTLAEDLFPPLIVIPSIYLPTPTGWQAVNSSVQVSLSSSRKWTLYFLSEHK